MFLAVDSCVPGDVVTVSGVVKVNSTDEGQSFLKKDTTKEKILPMDILYLIYPKSLFFFVIMMVIVCKFLIYLFKKNPRQSSMCYACGT